jgi:hypothetical protein
MTVAWQDYMDWDRVIDTEEPRCASNASHVEDNNQSDSTSHTLLRT